MVTRYFTSSSYLLIWRSLGTRSCSRRPKYVPVCSRSFPLISHPFPAASLPSTWLPFVALYPFGAQLYIWPDARLHTPRVHLVPALQLPPNTRLPVQLQPLLPPLRHESRSRFLLVSVAAVASSARLLTSPCSSLDGIFVTHPHGN
jgi:hypothetical protein